jgi:hypothetical protein
MPEAPEIHVLALALKSLGFQSEAYGKHLFIIDIHSGKKFDITFGLGGKIKLDPELNLKKIPNPELPSGDFKEIDCFEDKKYKSGEFGINWLTSTREELAAKVKSWNKRRKQIGALLIDQHEICGIGVAWASEILYEAGIQPDEKSSWIEFLGEKEALIEALLSIRQRVLQRYTENLKGNMVSFVNEWFQNLYEIRKPIMKVYQKGLEKKISGRIWYI